MSIESLKNYSKQEINKKSKETKTFNRFCKEV